MSESKRDSSEAAMTILEKRAAWVGPDTSDMQNRTVTRSIVDAYDELDYRLMATFPASDAVAQY